MNTEAALLAALHLDPADEVTWLALADWLEEHGRADQARLLRNHRALRAMPEGEEKATRHLEIQQAINDGLRPVWPRLSNSIGMELALIPAGTFLMGSLPDEDDHNADETRHEVQMSRPFYLGVHPVTQAQYRAVMRKNPSEFRPRGPYASIVKGQDVSTFPVESVSWNDAVAFCRKLSARKAEAGWVYRLPTEAEWEYACRAWGGSLPYYFGDELRRHLAWYDWWAHADREAHEEEEPNCPCPVGRFPPNAFGLFDLHGNVDEWCSDLYDSDYYQSSPRRDPQGPADGEDHVIRGGGYDDWPEHCRTAWRFFGFSAEAGDNRGFRVACDWR